MAGIYNTTDGPLLIDRAGRVLGARESLEDGVDVTASPVSGHIAAGRLVVLDEAETTEATPTPSRNKRGTTNQEG